jgi:uncharacterized protein YkwD
MCGHYTQVVWANTRQVGCGVKQCGGNKLIVCNYMTGGNYAGQRPYAAVGYAVAAATTLEETEPVLEAGILDTLEVAAPLEAETSAIISGGLTYTQRQQFLNMHNAVRAAVNPRAVTPIPNLVYNSALEATAQAWANRCQFAHNPGRSNGHPSYVGENVYQGGYADAISWAVNLWASEKPYYNYASNSCAAGRMCGHYTQIVWANTRQIGCGIKQCGSNKLVVCNYMTGGNYIGQRPYIAAGYGVAAAATTLEVDTSEFDTEIQL